MHCTAARLCICLRHASLTGVAACPLGVVSSHKGRHKCDQREKERKISGVSSVLMTVKAKERKRKIRGYIACL